MNQTLAYAISVGLGLALIAAMTHGYRRRAWPELQALSNLFLSATTTVISAMTVLPYFRWAEQYPSSIPFGADVAITLLAGLVTTVYVGLQGCHVALQTLSVLPRHRTLQDEVAQLGSRVADMDAAGQGEKRKAEAAVIHAARRVVAYSHSE